MSSLDTVALARAANEARGLAMDAVHACSSGHLGLPLGAAEAGAVLFGQTLQICPEHPRWINRDRFVLSAGHGSMFLYGWLHLAGFGITLEDLKNFRKLNSPTPGHPEFGHAPGVEATTGPLGQGIANAVGMAVSGKMAEARFNLPEHPIFDYRVVALAGDGCLQEGVAAEAIAWAGRFGLDNLIVIYDSNAVTLDAMAEKTQLEDTAARFQAFGWDVRTVDGHNLEAFHQAYQEARASRSGKPHLIIARTTIAKGIPEVEGTPKGHGEAGAKFIAAARQKLGLPETSFFVSEETRHYFERKRQERSAAWKAWEARFQAWEKASPERAALLRQATDPAQRPSAQAVLSAIPAFAEEPAIATRKAGSDVLQPLAKVCPLFVSGSADLHGSTLNYIKDAGDFDRATPAGRNLYFGIREHAMGAMLNGMAYDGLFRPSGATFLSFSDYMRPAVRLAALSGLPVTYIWTHDSVGVGEDGPTHQPVEMFCSLRAIPNLDVIRPADPEETAGAFAAALERQEGPTALILSRQAVPTLKQIPVADRRQGVLKGAYIAHHETGPLRLILIGTGSELQHALAAAEKLGQGIRVISMPCVERFQRQSAAYQESVLPKSCRKRIVIEAGITLGWHAIAGDEGKIIGIDRFGLSAPGGEVMKVLGISAESVLRAARELGIP